MLANISAHGSTVRVTLSRAHISTFGRTDTRAHSDTDRGAYAQPNHVDYDNGDHHNTAQRVQRSA
jgi:hypothetical protein